MTGQSATPTPRSTPTPSTPSSPVAPPSQNTIRMDQVMATTGMGSDVGVKAGVGALVQAERLHDRVVDSFDRGYNRVASDLSNAAYGAAVTTGSAVLLSVSTYVVRETYYYFRPTPEMVREKELRKAELERKIRKNESESERHKTEAEFQKCKRERAGSVKSFKDCLYRNRSSRSFTAHGYPEECSEQAFSLSLEEDGESEVVSLARRFAKFAPMKREDGK